jgi:general secretion pathway protein K
MNQRGLVLMSVLWVVLVVAFVAFALAAAVRAEVASAGNSFDSERAYFMAKSAAEVVFLNLQKPDTLRNSPVREAKGTYTVPFDSGQAVVQLVSESDRIDLNAADDKLLASMFDSLGLDEVARNELVDCILDWRDPDDVPRLYGAEVDQYGQVFRGRGRPLPGNAPFNSMEEVAQVKHMTSEVYFGRVEPDPLTGKYRKIPGVRDIATVSSGSNTVNINLASADVLAALPQVGRTTAEDIVAERQKKLFAGMDDFLRRIPILQNSLAIPYMSTNSGVPTTVVSTATIRSSGATRTARLSFTREHQKKILSAAPLLYLDIEVLKFRGWQY